MRVIPVFLFTGFLDSGKTTMIRQMLQSGELGTAKKTLLLLCERGEEELSLSFQKEYGLRAERIAGQKEYTRQRLDDLCAEGGYERVIVEYNGFWPMQRFHMQLPDSWYLAGKFFCADAGGILSYDGNLQSLVGEKIKSSALALINRVPVSADCAPFHDMVRKYSGRCEIRYERTDRRQEKDTLPNAAPYDLLAQTVQIPDHLFGYFMTDVHRSPELYAGKQVRLRVCAVRDPDLPENQRLLGRNATFATIKEAAFWGMAGAFETVPSDNEWIEVTANMERSNSDPLELCLAVTHWEPTSSLATRVAVIY